MSQITMNEDGRDVHYDSFPSEVITRYYDKNSKPIGPEIKVEFLTFATYLLWAMGQVTNFIPGTKEWSDFSYFCATRPMNKPVKLETQYVIRSYEFTR